MLSALLAGIVLGASAGLAPGPLLMLLLTQSLRYGAREGIKVAFAPILTDAPIVLACFLLLQGLSGVNYLLGSVSVVGGLYVFYLAYGSLRTQPLEMAALDEPPGSIRKAVLVNFLNPHPYLFWMMVGGPRIVVLARENGAASVAFVASFYALLVGGKIVLAIGVGHARTLLTGRAYVWVMRGLGVLLAVFACILLRDAARLLGLLDQAG